MSQRRKTTRSVPTLYQEFRILVNCVKDYAIYMIDSRGRIKTWNEGAVHIKGYAEQEVLGKHISIFYTQKDIDMGLVEQNLEKAKENGTFEQEGWRKRKDGSLFYANVVYTAIYDENDRLSGFAIVTRNITDRHQFRQNLLREVREKNRQLTLVFERVTDALVAFDKNWNYTFVNGVAAAILGRSPEELIGTNIWLEFPEKKASHIYHKFLAAMAEQKATQIEDYYAASDLWFNAVLYPSPDGLFVYWQDISEKKRSEIKLHQSYEQYRQIVETAQEGIWLIDEKNKTVFVNKRMCEILEYSDEEIKSNEYFHFIAEREQMEDAYHLIARKGIKHNADVTFITKTGRRIRTNLSANPVYDDKGVYKGALAMVTDITEKINLQEQLLKEQITRQREISKAAIRAQEKERAEIGRELHDNVNQILSASVLHLDHGLANQPVLLPSVRKSRRYICKAILEIRKLTKALVGPDSGRAIKLTKSVTDLVNDIMKVKDIQIQFIHSGFAEEQPDDGLKLALFRIIQEQLTNILKYAKASEVMITLKKEEGKLSLMISDNGIGFNVSAARKGIGFSNIKNRAEIYNGQVSITSSPGNGCSLHINFEAASD